MLALLVEAATLFLPISIQAATFHVSPFGSNTPPYNTYATAAHEVADAANLAQNPGDTVLVHSGVYSSTDTIRIALGVTFAGVGRDSVTIDWGDTECRPGQLVSLAGANEVSGLHLRFPKNYGACGSITLMHCYTGENIKVHDCRFTEADVYLDGDTWLPGNGVIEVHDNHFDYGQASALFVGSDTCLVHDNRFTAFNADAGGDGISAWLAKYVAVERNIFLSQRHLNRVPIPIAIRECDSGIVRNNRILNCRTTVIWSETSGIIENNTLIWATPDWFASMEVFQGPENQVMIRNNVFMDMERPIVLGPQSGAGVAGLTTLAHNVFWPYRDTVFSVGSQPEKVPLSESLNVFAYPMFEDDSVFCPQAGSPLIDTGDPTLHDVDLSVSDIGWHGGPGGFACEYLEMSPNAPESIWVDGTIGIATVSWTSRPEADLAEYHLYRGTTSGFWSPGDLPWRIVTPPDTAVVDTLLAATGSYYYVVTAVDTSGLESEPSFERGYTPTGIFDDETEPIPRSSALVRVYPNPFNTSTTIEVELHDIAPTSHNLVLQIVDVLGRTIAMRQIDANQTEKLRIPWDARTDEGIPVSSGVYLLRISTGDLTLNSGVRLVVLK